MDVTVKSRPSKQWVSGRVRHQVPICRTPEVQNAGAGADIRESKQDYEEQWNFFVISIALRLPVSAKSIGKVRKLLYCTSHTSPHLIFLSQPSEQTTSPASSSVPGTPSAEAATQR
jgi:hypothetical protein